MEKNSASSGKFSKKRENKLFKNVKVSEFNKQQLINSVLNDNLTIKEVLLLNYLFSIPLINFIKFFILKSQLKN